jgi:hypothetical protein
MNNLYFFLIPLAIPPMAGLLLGIALMIITSLMLMMYPILILINHII